jgi:hypothetical protein
MGDFRSTASTAGLNGFRNLLSRTVPSMSDDEMKEAARQQAQIDAANGVFQGDDMLRLRGEFMSVVSPNRVGIISRQLSTISANWNGGASHMRVTHSSGCRSAGGTIAEFIPGRGWAAALTRAESARSKEILQIYNEAWRDARFGVGGNSNDDDRPPVNARNLFDSQA